MTQATTVMHLQKNKSMLQSKKKTSPLTISQINSDCY